VQGVQGEAETVAADELDAQPLEAELALAAQLQDQPFLTFEHLAPGRAARPAASLLEPSRALRLVAAPPLAQGRA
jgi:hypothetical protein